MDFGVFGGSFDPPHISHVLACLWAVETGEVERVLVIPCGEHVLGKLLRASFDDRLEMCRRAFARVSAFVEVLDIEGRRAEKSYTIDTLRALQAERPGHRWRLLIGTDILGETRRWRAWEEIERLAPPLVVPRLTGDVVDSEARAGSREDGEALSPSAGSGKVASRAASGEVDPGEGGASAASRKTDLRALSSTVLRDQLERGRAPKGLIPASVLDYIREKELYRSAVPEEGRISEKD